MKMDKKISAALIAMLFVLGIVAVPVSAHFTMGTHIPAYPFRSNHFDPHTKGLVGYVFPGGGLFTQSAPGWYSVAGEFPGYQSPWPYWTSGVSNPFPSQGPMGWYQLDANNYAPFGAILTSTIAAGTPFSTMWQANQWASDNPTIESLAIEHAVKGDLILAFNVTGSQKTSWHKSYTPVTALNFTFAEMLIPPEFTGLARSKIVTSITNNYDLISISTRKREDYSYGPYWNRIRVYTDTYTFGADQASADKMDDAPDSWLSTGGVGVGGPFQFSPWKTFGNITFNIVPTNPNDPEEQWQFSDEWYYIRVNDVTAPTIAGAYFIRTRRLYTPDCLDGITYDSTKGSEPKVYGGYVSFPSQNYPVVLVKGEVDPAIITGTIRYGGWNTAVYGNPVALPGRVRAVGYADDPYTFKSTGRPVEARGYFDAAWSGHYEVEGVAAGVYDIYASAAGFPEIKIASNVKILKGQSYHVDGYLIPGVQVKGTVFSKCGTGEVPWGFTGPDANIKVEIYRSLQDAQSMLPGGSTTKAVSWSPIKYGAKMWTNSRATYPYDDLNAGLAFYYAAVEPTATTATRAKYGVGPAQNWYVTSTDTSFTFQFGREGRYGVPADMDAHVPGSSPDWVSGIGPGTYWVRAWLYGYVQTEIDGVTFMPVTFTVPSVEWPGNVWIPFDLRQSSMVKKTVHFHDIPGTLMENPIGWGWSYRGNKNTQASAYPTLSQYDLTKYYRYLSAELAATGSSNYNNPAGDAVFAWNVDPVGVGNTSYTILVRGFRELGLWYGYGRNYGIPAGLYSVKAYMWGYVEQVFEKVNLGLCGTVTTISDHLYRGANFNITVYSKDWEHPTADKYWSFPYQPIYVQIMKDGKFVGPTTDYYVMPVTMQGYRNTTAAVWPYMWNNPIHMIKTHDAVAQVFGTDGYAATSGLEGTYFENYFGPVPTDANYHYRLYDGSESYAYYYYVPGSYGRGYTVGIYPYAFESGIYDFKALTYGYVQKKPVMVGATKGNSTSDILIKLTQGAELQLNIKLKHEGVFEGMPFDAHLRVRVLDDKNKLVGEYLSSDWWWQPQFEWTTNSTRWSWNLVQAFPSTILSPTDDAKFAWGHPFDSTTPSGDDKNGHRNVLRLNYVPKGTPYVKVVIAGLPDLYGWTGGYACDPCAATGDAGWDNHPGKSIDAPYGIDGYPNYMGGWKIQVHVVPIYNTYAYNDPYFSGMLTGELTYTADMTPVLVNHLGPYELRYDVVVPGTHLGGESSAIFELDRLGLITGYVFGYTYCDDWRTVSWTNVKFVGADNKAYDYYTFDGKFAAWLKPGPYTASVIYWTPTKGEGYKVQTMPYHVSDGAFGAFNVYLEQSQVPIPEFPVAAIVLASALAASLFILRRRRK